MVEALTALQTEVGSETIRCLCPGNYWESLRPHLETGFPLREFLAAVRHEFQLSHVRNGIEMLVVAEPTLEDLQKIATRESLAQRGLLRLFIMSPFKNPYEATLTAFPEVEEEAIQQKRVSDFNSGEVGIGLVAPVEIQTAESQADWAMTESFARLYDEHYDRVYKQLYYRVGKPDVAEDLAAQTFMNAWRAYGNYQDMGRSIVFWLLKIAHNLLVDHYRAGEKEKGNESVDDIIIRDLNPDNNPEQAAEESFRNTALRQAISRLRTDQRTAIAMRYIEGMEYGEIAARLQKSEGAIRVIVSRGLKSLRDIMTTEIFPPA